MEQFVITVKVHPVFDLGKSNVEILKALMVKRLEEAFGTELFKFEDE